jgi:hypothetical protein
MEIETFKEQGDNIMLMLDGNDDMRKGEIHRAFNNCQLRECILEHHGNWNLDFSKPRDTSKGLF